MQHSKTSKADSLASLEGLWVRIVDCECSRQSIGKDCFTRACEAGNIDGEYNAAVRLESNTSSFESQIEQSQEGM